MAHLRFLCTLMLVALASVSVRALCTAPDYLAKTCIIPLGYKDSGTAKPNCTDIFADRSHARSLFNAITNHGKVPLSSDCVQCSADQSLTEWSNAAEKNQKVCFCVPIPVSTDPPCRCVLSRLSLRGTFNLTLLGAFPCDIDVSHNGFTEIASTASSAPKLQRLIINNNQLNSIPVSDVGTGSGLPSQLRYLDASSNSNLTQWLPSLEKFPAALEYLSFANCPEVDGVLQVPATQTSNLMTFLLTHSKVKLQSTLCDTFRTPFFSKLKHLDLSDNMQMTGEVHVTDTCFSSALVNVVLQHCQFYNMFTVTPSTLTELECVDVSGNSFVIPATTALHNLSFPGGRLRTLVLAKSLILGTLPVLDGNTIPRSMQFLDLSFNTISGTLQLGDFSSPFNLDISRNDLQALGFVPTKRPALANLSFLALAHNSISSAVDMLTLSEVRTLDLSENSFKSPTSQLVALYPSATWECIALNDNAHAGSSSGLTGGLDIRNFSTTLQKAFFEGNGFAFLYIENDIFSHRKISQIEVDEALCLKTELKTWPEQLRCGTLQPCTVPPTTQPPSNSEDSFFSKPIGLLVVCLSVVLVVGAAGAILWIRRRHACAESPRELSRFFNRGFALVEKIGGGAFGTVYRVKRTTDNREFALKEVNFEREETWQEALHEFNIMKKAQGERLMPHPNIVQLEVMYMSWRNDDNDAEQSEPDHLLNGEGDKPHRSQKVMCLVMEFFHDGTLKDRIDRKAMTEREVVVALKQLLNALVYLHNLNPPIIHRDIKPENVLLEGERVALTDFGLSSARLDAVTNAGTPNYQAPEIAARRKYSAKVDVFSTGAVAYSMMTRRCGRRMKKLQAECRKPNFFAELEAEMEMGAFSPELIQFVLWMLTIDPDQRPTAEEAQKRLDDLSPAVTIHHIVSVPIFTPDAR